MKYLAIITFILSFGAGANSLNVLRFDKSQIQDVIHTESGLTAVDLVRDPSLTIENNIIIINLDVASKIEEILLENGNSISLSPETKVVGGDGDSGGN